MQTKGKHSKEMNAKLKQAWVSGKLLDLFIGQVADKTVRAKILATKSFRANQCVRLALAKKKLAKNLPLHNFRGAQNLQELPEIL